MIYCLTGNEIYPDFITPSITSRLFLSLFIIFLHSASTGLSSSDVPKPETHLNH
jgi:hypothetical protein